MGAEGVSMKLNVSMAEAAKMVGIQASKMQELLETGEVPAWRDGRNWKIPIVALQDWNENKAYMERLERRNHDQETLHSTGDGKDSAGVETGYQE